MANIAFTAPPAASWRPLARVEAALAGALDAERGRWFYWLPVFFACGIGAYFALPFEPPLLAALAVLAGAAGVRVFLRRDLFAFLIGSAMLAGACGFAIAKLRADFAAAPLIAKSVAVKLEGWVEKWEQTSPKRGRLTMLVRSAEGLAEAQTPHRVRITVNAASGPQIGAAIAVPAVLMPLPEPVAPRAHDFARQAWFSSLGAGGFATGPLTTIADAPPAPLKLRALAALAEVRGAIATRIAAALPASTAPIAQALIMGERVQMSDADTDALRASGLYHVISISGLHMALVGGVLFWTIRLLFALIPSLALRYPVKKWAAGAAIVFTFGYLLLSGSAVAALRSFLMIAVMLLAIMLDRPAVSLRNVALSALLILVVLPESLLDASFQMSFAATAALIAFFERYRDFFAARTASTRGGRWAQSAGGFLTASVMTSVIAGAAVAPLSAYHFHNVASYSVVGNVIAMPVISLVVMPMAILALFAMPFGLEAWPLAAMGWGIEVMLAIARWVAALDGAMLAAPAYPLFALLAMTFGGLWLMIWHGRWRYLGAVPIAAGVASMSMAPRPDIVIERGAAVIAVRVNGTLQISPGRKGHYSAEQWLKADGDSRKPKDANKGGAFRCDEASCVTMASGKLIAFTQGPAALAEDCARADILIAPFVISQPCPRPQIIIDRRALTSGGAHAVYLGARMRVETARQFQGVRPWAPSREMREHIPPISYDKATPAQEEN